MKKFFVLVSLLLSLIILSGCLALIKTGDKPTPSVTTEVTPEVTEEPGDGKSKEYVNEEYSFKTRYPSDWTLKFDIPGTLVTFMAPDDTGFVTNINILVEKGIGALYSLEEYADLATEQLSGVIADFDLVDFDEYETDNWKGYYIIYTGKYTQMELAWAQVFFMENNDVYIITFATTPDEYDIYVSDAEFIADNLQLIK